MRIKTTFICENNKDISILGDNPQEQIDKAYELFAKIMSSLGDEKMTFVSAEILNNEMSLKNEKDT